ncbi:hypothetical protein C9374_014414 [Naegleria lovaniensis]|uniref:DH domain-containing protein n=1 Tax=Naegleria lovaniensis TaxID=51637 RepID=A0AA88H0G5_NAELO|nr:uncharacterized protein C9374_014414 [Naegleria lovaniensis]KAG2389014.1 hypothetical protein C9374_014414 [Naegleria lovaniensis]
MNPLSSQLPPKGVSSSSSSTPVSSSGSTLWFSFNNNSQDQKVPPSETLHTSLHPLSIHVEQEKSRLNSTCSQQEDQDKSSNISSTLNTEESSSEVVSTPNPSAADSIQHSENRSSLHLIQELTKLLKMEKEKNRILLMEKQIWKQKEKHLSQILHNDLENLKQLSDGTSTSIGNSTPQSTTNSMFFQNFNNYNNSQYSNMNETVNTNGCFTPMTSTSSAPSPVTSCSSRSQIHNNMTTPIPPPKPLRLVTRVNTSRKEAKEEDLLEYIKEFINLEKEYMMAMKCVNRYFLPLIHECFKKREISCFPNLLAMDHLLVLMKLNSQLYQEFDNLLHQSHSKRSKNCGSQDQLAEHTTLFEGFLTILSENVHKLRIFKLYTEHLPTMLQLVKKELKSNEVFREYVRRSEKHLYSLKGSLWRVDSFFKFPLEYIPRALEILQQLKSVVERGRYAESETLAMIVEKYSKIQSHIYKSTKPKVDLSQMTEIAESLEMIGLVTASRYLIKSGLAEKMRESGAVTPCRLFLFNDMLIIKYTRKYRWLCVKKVVFYLDEICLQRLPLVCVKNYDSNPYLLTVIRGNFEQKQYSITIRFREVQEVSEWMELIEDCIDKECTSIIDASARWFPDEQSK